MPEAKKISISKELENFLDIKTDVVNAKIQEAVNRRVKAAEDDMFVDTEVAKDYMELFSKEELIAMFLHVAAQAGILEFKLLQLVDEANIPIGLFEKVMQKGFLSDSEIIRRYKDDGSPIDDEEDFI